MDTMSLAPKEYDIDKEFDEVWRIINDILTEDYSGYHELFNKTVKFIDNDYTIHKFMEKFEHRIENHVKLLNTKISAADDLLYKYSICCASFYKGMHWVDVGCDIINRTNDMSNDMSFKNDKPKLRDIGIKAWVKLVMESRKPSLTEEIMKSINNFRNECNINYDKEWKILQQTINSFLGVMTKPVRKHDTVDDKENENERKKTYSELCSDFRNDYVANANIYYKNFVKKTKSVHRPELYLEEISRCYEMEKKILDSLFIQEEEVFRYFFKFEKNEKEKKEEKIKNEEVIKKEKEEKEEKIKKEENEEKEEMKRLSTIILEEVIKELKQTMVDENIGYFREGLAILTKKEDETVLSKVYDTLKLFKEETLTELAKIVEKHITDIGIKSLEKIDRDNHDNPIDFVNEALSIYSKYSNMIYVCFKDNHYFIKARDKAICSFLNAKHNNRGISMSAQYLAKYYDKILKEKGNDDKLDITLFRYLDDKDLFERYYAKYLAKRLISGSSHNSDKEEKMISKFKENCGYEYCRKFQQIYKDKSISDDLNSKFVEHLKVKDKEFHYKFVPHIASQGSWPFSIISTPGFILPITLEESLSEFEGFYNALFQGKKLTWVYDMSTVDVQLTYTKKYYIATMSVFQSAILMQFESTEELTYSQLLGATNLKDNQLLRNLNGLIEQKILICNASHLHPETPIRLNLMFENKKAKFKVPLPQPPRTPAKENEDKVFLDKERMFYLEAVIVRIMKAKKSMTRNALVEETINQARSRFCPGVKLINKAIQRLLEKEYIEGPEKNSNTFKYVA
ncbi:cullin-2-like [Artemia franciscana]|uniref:Cullin family profile domain-containing protein n=1 Tax=Artemia franciscana TaxID=6661 RepID=A0AA88H7Y2_ARTSF|nr:hypothetical protein QYM36_017381 [Artemia franciscana]